MNQDIYVVVEHLLNRVLDISYVTLAAARALAKSSGGSVVAVLLGYNAQALAANCLADRVLYVNHHLFSDFNPDAYQYTIGEIIQQNAPRAVLFGNTTIGSDLASVLSVRLNLPLVTSCQYISDNAEIISKIYGGKIMVESELPDSTALLTIIPGGYKPEEGQSNSAPLFVSFPSPEFSELRMSFQGYIEPEAADVDISKEPILISVGRGISNQDNIELAEELAQALGGVVSSSRPVVDLGWLPSSRLVGKSGFKVKPKLYFTLGISGAPEHVEAITDSEVIIAINTDLNAPIFDIAKYGAEIDMFDLLEVLTTKIQEAKNR